MQGQEQTTGLHTATGASTNRSVVELKTDLRSSSNYWKAIGQGWGQGWSGTPSDTQKPLVAVPLSTNGGDEGWESPGDKVGRIGLESGITNSPQVTHAVASAQDVERITKLLSSPRGLMWETHLTEAESLRRKNSQHWKGKVQDIKANNVSSEGTVTTSSFGKALLESAKGLVKDLGKNLITAATVSAKTLAQIGLDGTLPGTRLENTYGFDKYLGSIETLRAVEQGKNINTKGVTSIYGENFEYKPSDEIEERSKYSSGSKSYTEQAAYMGYPEELQNVMGSKLLPDVLYKQDEEYLAQFNLIPFEIQVIDPFREDNTKYLYFQANLDSFEDNYTGNWNESSYVGRAENFYVYTGFKRNINLSFKAVARTHKELFSLYEQLNALVGTTAPSYNEQGLFMGGTLVKLTVGDYLTAQTGFFGSVKLTWKTEYPWEINGESIVVPHLLDVSVGFTPIHDFNVDSSELSYIGDIYRVRRADPRNSVSRMDAQEMGLTSQATALKESGLAGDREKSRLQKYFSDNYDPAGWKDAIISGKISI